MRTFRAYVLLELERNKSQEVAKALRDKPGVVAVDVVEGPPDLVAVLEASERLKLAETTARILESVETLVNCVSLLPVQDDIQAFRSSRLVAGSECCCGDGIDSGAD